MFPRPKEEKGVLVPKNRKCKGPEGMSGSKDGKRSVFLVSRGRMCRKVRYACHSWDDRSTFAFAKMP